MAGLTFDTGGCPPGYYRPGIFNDCRPGSPPVVTPVSAYFAPEGASQPDYMPRTTQGASTNSSYLQAQGAPYQQPIVSAPVSGGGISSTMLIILAVAAVVLLKK